MGSKTSPAKKLSLKRVKVSECEFNCIVEKFGIRGISNQSSFVKELSKTPNFNQKKIHQNLIWKIFWFLVPYIHTVFPRIVSALEQFPPLNSFRTCMYCNQRSQYIRLNSKNNSFRGNYSRKYGIWICCDRGPQENVDKSSIIPFESPATFGRLPYKTYFIPIAIFYSYDNFVCPSSQTNFLWTIYSATTVLEKCRKVVLDKQFCKLGFFFLVNHFSPT